MAAVPLEKIKGLLRLTVKRGIGLAVRDVTTSDPYIVVCHGDQKVYDSDMFFDDTMGDAEVDITPFMDSVTNNEDVMENGTIIAVVTPGRENNLIEASNIIWKDGKVTQNMFLRLRNVECGEIELMIQWIQVNSMRRTSMDL